MGSEQGRDKPSQARDSLRGRRTVAGDPHGRSMSDPDSVAEARFLFLGADPSGRVLITAYTMRANVTRIISSRKASRSERQIYEAQ
ncbi:MAG: BrnT family toxin [Dokdonella sp.]